MEPTKSNVNNSNFLFYSNVINEADIKPSSSLLFSTGSTVTREANKEAGFLFPLPININAPIELDNNLIEVDVPHDGNCLFWAVAINYLLPAINNDSEFRARFIKIFGEDKEDYINAIKALFSSYDINSGEMFKNNILTKLVTKTFRNNIVNYMQENLSEFKEFINENVDTYLSKMGHRGTWGGELEIRAMSDFLQCNIKAYKLDSSISNYGHESTSSNSIIIKHVNDTHYHYIINKANLSDTNLRNVQTNRPDTLTITTELDTSASSNIDESGMVPYSQDDRGVVAIIKTFQSKNYDEIPTILQRIEKDKTKLSTKDKEQLVEVMFAQPNEKLFKYFLEKFDEEVNEITVKYGSLIHLAAARNLYIHVQFILDGGVAFDQPNSRGETPLFIAIRYGTLEFVQNHIYEYASEMHSKIKVNIDIEQYNIKNCDFLLTPVGYAVLCDQPEIVSFLLDKDEIKIGKDLKEILELIVIFERYTILTIFLKHKKVSDIHQTNSSPIAEAFTYAAQLCRPKILKNLACQFPEVVQNIKDAGYLPIHRAIGSPNEKLAVLETINCLRNLGVDLTQRDENFDDAVAYVNKLLKEAENKKEGKNVEKYIAIRNVLKNKIVALDTRQYKLLHCKVEDIEALVFSGGGPKGVAYIGVLKQLSDLMSTTEGAANFNNIRRIAGTSAGAITAGLLAVGYTPEELSTELLQQPILDFVDNNIAQSLIQSKGNMFVNMLQDYYKGKITWKKCVDTMNSLKQETHGLCEGKKLVNWIEECICKKIAAITKLDKQKCKYLTFGELKELRATHKEIKDLYIVTTNLSGNEPEIRVFSSEDESSKNNIISYTIRASMSIPILFNVAHEYIKHNGHSQKIEGTYYVDGGLIRNRPIDIFDKSKYIQAGLSSEKQDYPVYNERVIGFVLDEDGAENRSQSGAFTTQDYLSRLFSAYYNVERILSNTKANNNRIIAVNCGKVNMLSFNLSEEEKDTLINTGAEAVRYFFPLGPQ